MSEVSREDLVAWARRYENYSYSEEGPVARAVLDLVQSEAKACVKIAELRAVNQEVAEVLHLCGSRIGDAADRDLAVAVEILRTERDDARQERDEKIARLYVEQDIEAYRRRARTEVELRKAAEAKLAEAEKARDAYMLLNLQARQALRGTRCAYCRKLPGDEAPIYPATGSCEGCVGARAALAAGKEADHAQ